jgi:alpha-glucosidase (family GH31 glycosyl hydrolase)
MNYIFQGENYRITLLTEQLVRLEYSEEGYFEDGTTQVVQNRHFPKPQCEVIETEEELSVITDFIHLHYTKGEFSPKNLFIDTKNNYSPFGNRWYYGEEYPTLKGTASTLDNVDGSITLEEGIISKNGFALLDDSESFLLVEGQNPEPRPNKQIDLYFFGYGRNYYQALQDFYQLTGSTPLLPRYALGNWWSRFWRYSEASYLELMDKFEQEKVPLSVSVIDMDWHKTEVPERFGSGWTGYSWNKDLFPDPKRFLKTLQEKGLKTSLNVHPADGIRAFEDAYPQVAARLGLNQELEEPAIFNIFDEQFRESYFEDVHHPLEEQGVDFWWIDWQQGIKGKMSEIDPLWLLNYYHFHDISRKNQQDIILSRYAGPGSHRYPVGFSGDTITTWESLAFQPYFTSTASNIGYSWWSHDIGGHMNGYHDEELTLRWVQLGVFSPINRLHSSSSSFNGKEPWSFSESTAKSMKAFLHLRHELLPYLYSMNVRNSEKAIPLVLPMYYDYPVEEQSYEVANQYLFGSEMFVAPITEKTNPIYKTAKVNVWFPEGIWYDFFTEAKYSGDVKMNVYRKTGEMPVFVKEGSIIPLDHRPAMQGTAFPEVIDWHIFPGASNVFELVEDKENQRVVSTLKLDWEAKTVELSISGDTEILPNNRQHRLIFRAMDGEAVLLENKNQRVDIPCSDAKVSDVNQRIFDCLNIAEISYELKHQLMEQLVKEKELSKILTSLILLETDLRERLFEIIYTAM